MLDEYFRGLIMSMNEIKGTSTTFYSTSSSKTVHTLINSTQLHKKEKLAHFQCKSIQNMTMASISDTYEIDAIHAKNIHV